MLSLQVSTVRRQQQPARYHMLHPPSRVQVSTRASFPLGCCHLFFDAKSPAIVAPIEPAALLLTPRNTPEEAVSVIMQNTDSRQAVSAEPGLGHALRVRYKRKRRLRGAYHYYPSITQNKNKGVINTRDPQRVSPSGNFTKGPHRPPALDCGSYWRLGRARVRSRLRFGTWPGRDKTRQGSLFSRLGPFWAAASRQRATDLII